MIPRADIHRLESSQYQLRLSHGGQELFSEEAFTCMEDALTTAAATTGPIRGFEVAYEGLCVGTYTAGEMEVDAAAITARALALHATFAREC